MGEAGSDDERLWLAFSEGARMAVDAADGLERQLEERPGDLEQRARLLGLYSRHRHAPAAAVYERKRHHVLWIIEHQPASHLASLVSVGCVGDAFVAGYVIAAWRARLASFPEGDPSAARAFLHAAECARYSDKDLHREWRERARTLVSDAASLERITVMEIGELSHPIEEGHEAERLARMEEIARDPRPRAMAIEAMAVLAFDLDDRPKARLYAEELLATVALSDAWNAGNAHFRGHSILGRLALRAGDIERAKGHLILSARTVGSPQLNSFGPSMLLAKELLEKDERFVVLAFFKACGAFWELGADRLERWSSDVRAGGMPNFGANLRY